MIMPTHIVAVGGIVENPQSVPSIPGVYRHDRLYGIHYEAVI